MTRRFDHRLPLSFDVAAALEDHPSMTAHELARRITTAVGEIADNPDDIESGDLRRALQRAAAFASASWRDPYATHLDLIAYRALERLGV